MEKFNCFPRMCGYGHKDEKVQSKAMEFNKGLKSLKEVRVARPMNKPLKSDDTSVDSVNLAVYEANSPVKDHITQDEHEKNVPNSFEEEEFTPTLRSANLVSSEDGHISDPGARMAPFWGSPKLKRSCSNLETTKVMRKIDAHLAPEYFRPRSPVSVISCRSADRVMLKKHSSSQIFPSGSRKLWWKLFLWSHRNLHKPSSTAKPEPFPVSNQQGGYSSDTLEQSVSTNLQSTASTEECSRLDQTNHHALGKQKWDGFDFDASKVGAWPRDHWVANAFLSRVDQWVQDIEIKPQTEDETAAENGIDYPPSPARNTSQVAHRLDDIVHANSVILSLNSSSAVAHICGAALKVIPSLSPFSSLRTVDLSNNSIVSITPGSLPKGLHAVNLSRNKINAVEGLRELTRLRVLDLSYNRISRIGQGLSNCTLIKELYLSGNKISDVEGLHRLLKLTVLDLSFNKVTTTKALGQLVANYIALQALNLLGNPVQTNIGDDQLRRAVRELLPNLKYLNKQPIKAERAREVAMDSVARAALGHSSSTFRHKRPGRRTDTAGSSSCTAQRGMASAGAKRSKNIGKKSSSRSLKGRSSSTPRQHHS
ncbi:Dynein axonemal assembly factor 1 [Linum grandiflorum]